VFAQGPYFRALVAKQGAPHEELLDQAFEAADLLGASWVFIVDARGRLLAKSDEPAAMGTELGGVPLVAGALRGQVTSGFGVTRDSALFQIIAVPIAVPGAAPVGALVATTLVGDEVVRDARATTGSEVLFYAVGTDGRARVAATSLPRSPALDSVLRALAPPARRGRRRPTGCASRARPTSRRGRRRRPRAARRSAAGRCSARATTRRAWSACASRSPSPRSSGLALSLGAAWLVARRVTRPIRALAAAARRAADGDYDPSRPGAADGESDRSDEIASLGAAFHAVLADLRGPRGAERVGPERVGPERVRPERARGARRDAQGAARAAGSPARPRRAAAGPAPGGARRHPGAGRHLGAGRGARRPLRAAGGRRRRRHGDRAPRARPRTRRDGRREDARPELLAADPLARERLTHEVRLARRVSHRHVVRIHDLAESDGVPFLTMEFVDGPSLATVLRLRSRHPAESRGLPPRAVLAVAKQLARALDVAHAQGVVHGDLKPANLLVAPGGVLKVSDFGVARLVRAPVGPDAARIAGAVVGTPEYMAPELLLGRAPDVLADVYAAGVVLHECLTGETPFHADTPVAFFARKLDESGAEPPRPATPPAPRAPIAPRGGLADELAALVRRLTQSVDHRRPPQSARRCTSCYVRLG
jgi:serine/threonine-protein kinase